MQEKISEALQAHIQRFFPGEILYIDLAPQDFARPSNLLELVKAELDASSFGLAAVTFRYHYKITTFAVVDPVHDTHLPELDRRAVRLLSSFGAGYLRVGDRAPKVQSCTADTSSYDAAEITVVLSLTVDRSDLTEPAEEPVSVMQNVQFNHTTERKK